MSPSRILLLLLGLLLLNLGAQTDWEKAAEFRKAENDSRAEKLLSRYASPANCDALKPAEKVDFLRGMMELAHIRAATRTNAPPPA